jgi:molecular chaperone GrpE
MYAEKNVTEENAIETESAETKTPAGNDNSVRETESTAGNGLPEDELNEEALAEWLDSIEDEVMSGDSAENSGVENGKLPDSGGKEPDTNDKIAELEARAADLAAQLADVRDQLLRKAADFENFRKRMNQEKQKAIEFANESLLLDIIPIIDDFERAIQSAEVAGELAGLPAGKAMLDGITMIEKRLVSQLESKWGLKRFNSAGEPFDPNIHEAVYMEKSPDVDEPVVQEDLIKGYMLKDRVIRAAKVKVLMPEEKGIGSGE